MKPAVERRQRRELALWYPQAAARLAAAELDWRISRSGGMRPDGNASGLSQCRVDASRAVMAAAPADWREAWRQLRQAGHEVKQFGGVVLVDGEISGDPTLYPADARELM